MIIFAPNGIIDSFANLKNCFPNGIPIIVMHKITPHTTLYIAIGMPVISIQNILAIMLNVPSPYITSFPNGHIDSFENLKHCFPIGIPIIVMNQSRPAKNQTMPSINPPHKSHIKFPIVFNIITPFRFLFLKYYIGKML